MEKLNKDTLDERQKRTAYMKAMGMTHTTIAGELGVRRETVWAWAKLPAFQAEVKRNLEEIRQKSVNAMVEVYDKAIRLIEKRIADETMATKDLIKLIQLYTVQTKRGYPSLLKGQIDLYNRLEKTITKESKYSSGELEEGEIQEIKDYLKQGKKC